LKDKYKLTQEENRFVAAKNLVNMVYSNSKFEGVAATLAQTQTIINGMSVSGISIDDVEVIVDLKNAFSYIIEHDEPYTLKTSQALNRIVSKNDGMYPGEIRTGNVEIGGMDFVPGIPNVYEMQKQITELMMSDLTLTEKSLRLMYEMMRAQLFWDGNKRTAIIAANYLLINGGGGIINISINQLEKFNTLLRNFYTTGQLDELLQWTYDDCIYGIDYD